MVINGVPDRIRMDGWWLENSVSETPESTGPREKPERCVPTLRYPFAFGAMVFVVLLADWLFWAHAPGISVAVFSMFLSVAILSVQRKQTTRLEWGIVLVFLLVCNLPVIEHLQLLSILFSAIGISALVVWVCYGRVLEWWQAVWVILRVSTVGAILLPKGALDDMRDVTIKAGLKHHLKSLALPLGIGGVFLVLLTSANPLLERFFDQLARFDFLSVDGIYRVIFWMIAACLIWPYLNLNETWVGPVATPRPRKALQVRWFATLMNVDSVRNSLFLFNGLFLTQTAMDLAVLTGGVSLPESMTYAQYAHRGAYPLVATAILAGVFAIATHKKIEDHRILKMLMFLWLGQNLFLVIAAAFRLSLYVEVYTLTYLRIAAFIWMGLVFVGISLIVVQIFHSKSIGWLVRSNLIALLGTLYLCCFVNFAWLIAEYNLNNARSWYRLDEQYVCALGEHALPAIAEHNAETGRRICVGSGVKTPRHTPIENWRDWGFRDWRLQVYLAR
ncbi:DUF4173 domain-containing protein [Shimia sp.]|uniref:DUF4153 domain-containing protein n=1 Tax=Shimia sp. TaxID=1954381 RepID=UPI003B8BF74B